MMTEMAEISVGVRIAATIVAICVLILVSECVALAQSRSARKATAIKATAIKATAAPVRVDLDVLAWIESKGDPKARSRAGARGMYQLTRAAWHDAVTVIRSEPGREDVTFDYDRWVEDPTVSRCVAHTYINTVLPRQLTAARLDRADTTVAVPDTREARLAAYNAGALRVRKAFALATSERPWKFWLPHETEEFLRRYEQESARRLDHKAAETANLRRGE